MERCKQAHEDGKNEAHFMNGFSSGGMSEERYFKQQDCEPENEEVKVIALESQQPLFS